MSLPWVVYLPWRNIGVLGISHANVANGFQIGQLIDVEEM
jgi:hypothetical protein